jgi:hypothetical protein
MAPTAALPFRFRRGGHVVSAGEVTSTEETVHGLLRLEGERLVIQWRTARKTEHVGREIRVDQELEPVRELAIPLSALASARVRRFWLRWPPGLYLVLTASDLRAFEAVAGEGGLRLRHPAELVIRVGRASRVAAQEFASELELAVADRQLRAAEQSHHRALRGE